MSSIFSQLLQEGERQQRQVKHEVANVLPKSDLPSLPSSADSTTARQQAVKVAGQHDGLTARQHDSISAYTQAFLEAKASQKTTLRYSPSLMADIDDVIYQIRKTYGISLSKNEIFIAALANLLFDFRRNADHSVLATQLIQPQKR